MPKSKHVYLYIKNFPEQGYPIVTGTIKAIHGLATGLVSCGVVVTVVCEGEKNSIFKTQAGYEIRCFSSVSASTPFSVPDDLKIYFSKISKNNSIIILNGTFNTSVFGVSRYLYKHSIKYVFAPHGMYHPEAFKKSRHLKWPYWFLCERYVLKRAKIIQLLDKSGFKYLKSLGIKTPIISVPNGFFDVEVVAEDKLNWQIEGKVKVLYFGRIDIHTKALDVLLEAISNYKNDVNVELTIQGPDWDGEKVRLVQLVEKLNISEIVKFAEPEYGVPASELIAKYDIFCMPSRHEGFGLSALEAMLAGRVLLVSSSTGIAEHILKSSCGVVIEPNVISVVEGFKNLVDKRSTWENMGMAGRKYALNTFHWNKIATNALVEYFS